VGPEHGRPPVGPGVNDVESHSAGARPRHHLRALSADAQRDVLGGIEVLAVAEAALVRRDETPRWFGRDSAADVHQGLAPFERRYGIDEGTGHANGVEVLLTLFLGEHLDLESDGVELR